MADNFSPEEYEELKKLEALEKQYGDKLTGDTTPFQAKPRVRYDSGLQDTRDAMTPQLKAAAQSGVDIDTGAPPGVRTGYESFAANEGTFNDFIQRELNDIVGPEAKVRMGPVSGTREYYNPATKRWTILSDSSIGQKALSGASMSMNLAGSMAALLGTKSPTVATEMIAGAGKTALGTGLMDVFRQQIGNALGVNDDVPLAEEGMNAVKTAAKEGAADYLGAGAFNIARYMKNRILGRSRVFTDSEAQELMAGMDKYKGLVEDINKKSDVPFEPFLHQMVDPNSPAAKIAESKYGMLVTSPDEKIRLAVAQRRAGQYGALRSYFDNANAPFDVGIPNTAGGRAQAGAPLANNIQDQLAQRTAQANGQVDATHAAGAAAVNALPGGLPGAMTDAAQATRDQIWAQAGQSSSKVDEAYRVFNDRVRVDPRTNQSPFTVEVTDPGLVKVIDEMGRNSITKEVKGAGVTNPQGYVYDPSLRSQPPGKQSYATGKNGGAMVDLVTLDAARKRVKELARDKTVAGNNITYGTYDLVNADRKLDSLMSQQLKKASQDGTMPADTYDKWIDAKSAAIEDARTFKSGFLQDFLAKDETGEWVLKDQKALGSIIGGKDIEAAGQLKDMIAHDPVAMREVKKALFALYNKEATKGGLPSKALHEAFMKNEEYGPIMDIFFGKGEKDTLKSLGDVADSMAQSVVDAKNADKLIRGELGGKITKWSPEEMVRSVLSRRMDSKDAATLMRVARNDTGTTEAFRNGVMNEIQSKVFPTGTSGSMDLKALNRLLKDHGDKIAVVMGPQYYSSLARLRDTLPILQRNPSQIGDPPMSTVLQSAIRIQAGVMSPEGRFLTFLNTLGRANMPKQIWEALTNPSELDRLANYTRIAVERTRAAGTGSAVGTALLSEDKLRE